ncbi:MAG: dicarboxylate/amino acid:cation symporter [Candidatus Marinimicrobia bacterium]|jgi:Na+/H+-dicarboxylate symporter|nr:dicarboxylate/amino acid:cation symporter [Candidatus Neomarinimicrobiota bacterium]MBT3633299.1 dicarboxylate/amino acid:cation symporter [Candidatus Neomarinimicrobiota bacterium]MBT3681442.1 dicarboxylate/amino acid:cation symporter [Candidatus Neomarinimicrobiota bacterium]MBT3758591.1 dicarboxylate/amino acid:cation symporter [Candidatus Neomarinimicrobiota bacterium]MBT3894755.1 dicarboxylate/amino acid:cation symporter [Candidatus Neomarinimicrobiota bacterium]
MKNIKLHWQILIAMVLGIIFALIFKEQTVYVQPLGDIFMRLLKMVIVPLIFSSITFGVAGLDTKSLGRLGLKTFGYYALTSFIAIIIGLSLANIIQPGMGVQLSDSTEAFDVSKLTTPSSLGGIIYRMIPTNPVSAAAGGDVLGLIFFSIALGLAITLLDSKRKEPLLKFFDSFFHAMMKLTQLIIRLAPIGVFGLITKAVTNTGFELFKAIGMYMITIAIGLSFHIFIILPLIFYIFTRINPIHHFKAMASAMAMAFSTSSSGATLPVTMDCVENKVGASNRITSFVLPLGATINMDGTALYECAGALFIAQILGLDLSLTMQITVVITAFLASVGAAAIPSAGLVMIFIVLNSIGLGDHPEVAIIVGTMLAVDRPLDMFRTMVNVFSDSVGTAIIAKSEGENDLYPETLK